MQAVSLPLSRRELQDFASITGDYLDNVGRRPARHTISNPLTEVDFSNKIHAPFYKFVSDEAWSFISRGSFRFGSAPYYRNVENRSIRDQHEGVSFIHFTGNQRQWHAAVVAGDNCAIFCGARRHEGHSKATMRQQFGNRLIKISDTSAFFGWGKKAARSLKCSSL